MTASRWRMPARELGRRSAVYHIDLGVLSGTMGREPLVAVEHDCAIC